MRTLGATLLLLVALIAAFISVAADVTSLKYDGRSFLLNGERVLFIAGSIHYPRLAQSEWPRVFELAKENGLNLIQTYVFWDIHEPSPGEYYFPKDDSPNNLVKFIRDAQDAGLYVNLRIGPYVCAEWNYGGFPAWLRKVNDGNITFRTMDDAWIRPMSAFVDKVLDVVRSEKLLMDDGGPIVMLQIENEYGNIESNYGDAGAKYVQWASEFALSRSVGSVPWIMCQQGEGKGTAPPSSVINTCNGFYCDDWISGHQAAFPNQPAMWTENWPGWFQNWGDAIPHRPASDIAYAVARWFAKGGSYMNYYMAFGGTTFGRKVGGPLIVTSYDYDVQIDEYLRKSEPKFTVLKSLHDVLQRGRNVMLSQAIPAAVPLKGSHRCESHTYSMETTHSTDNQDFGCIKFLSNYGHRDSCTFESLSSQTGMTSIEVAPWSVTILGGRNCNALEVVYSTKSVPSATNSKPRAVQPLAEVPLSLGPCEAVPSRGVPIITSDSPFEQLSLTDDKTDYLWYTFTVPASESSRELAKLDVTLGTGGGQIMYLFQNGRRVADTVDSSRLSAISKQTQLMAQSRATILNNQEDGSNSTTTTVATPATSTQTFRVHIPAGESPSFSILSVSMGLQNYGPFLEGIQVGVVGAVTVDGVPITGGYSHAVGLEGETRGYVNNQPELIRDNVNNLKHCDSIRWLHGTFRTSDVLSEEIDSDDVQLAIDILPTLFKGAIFINQVHIGRYWNIVADDITSCVEDKAHSNEDGSCDNEAFVGPYSGFRCRTGCGQPSQRYYKVPRDVLKPKESRLVNDIVIYDESGKINKDTSITFVRMT